ncbi:hypothetical protein [Paenibacillus sp. N3.4]|uniref:hypothetical protein n=1 Tax=Paenibacillus sp. N3.4 TaxID=2603222 RepID=UPI0011CC02B1|nr:hypothetical protein [Paenibacillus sp. N3.4]TXK76015.1 hypothetical protein FU659_26635 [Paenibacillus sp. N3.4]
MPRKLTIYLGMVGALLFSIAHLMKWQSVSVLMESSIYVDEVVDFANSLLSYTIPVFCLSLILMGIFFINFSWEFAQQKVKVVSSLTYYSHHNEAPNTYSIIFKFIGVATIVLGFFGAIYIWSDGIKLPADKTSIFLFGLMPFLYALVGGLCFMGFGELLKLLQQIRDRNAKT